MPGRVWAEKTEFEPYANSLIIVTMLHSTFINVDVKRLLIGANLSYISGQFRVKYAPKYIQLRLLAKRMFCLTYSAQTPKSGRCYGKPEPGASGPTSIFSFSTQDIVTSKSDVDSYNLRWWLWLHVDFWHELIYSSLEKMYTSSMTVTNIIRCNFLYGWSSRKMVCHKYFIRI